MPLSTCFVVIKDTRCFTTEYDFWADFKVVCCDHCLWIRPLLPYITYDALLGGVRKCMRIKFWVCAEIKPLTTYTSVYLSLYSFLSSLVSYHMFDNESHDIYRPSSRFLLSITLPELISIYISRFNYNASRHGMPQTDFMLLVKVHLELTFSQYVVFGRQYLRL